MRGVRLIGTACVRALCEAVSFSVRMYLTSESGRHGRVCPVVSRRDSQRESALGAARSRARVSGEEPERGMRDGERERECQESPRGAPERRCKARRAVARRVVCAIEMALDH